MEVPPSVFIPAGAVRSKLRQEQRLYDVQCGLMLKELHERRRTLEQTRRRMLLELDLLEGTRDPGGFQYTGLLPADGTRDPNSVAYDIRVTRPRNRIPLRKVCTYRFDSINDADIATPVVINARRALVRLRNSASGRHRRAVAKPVSRSYSAPECVSKPEVTITTPPTLSIDRKLPPELNPQIKGGVVSESASTDGRKGAVHGESRNAKAMTRSKQEDDINVDIAAILMAQESLRGTTRVVRPLDLDRKIVPRNPKPAVKTRTFVYEKKTSPNPKKVASTQTARRQVTRVRYRTPTPLPPPRQLTASGAFDYVDDVITQVSMGSVPPGEPHPEVFTQVSLCQQQALSGAERTVKFELIPGEVNLNRQGTRVIADSDKAKADIGLNDPKTIERVETHTEGGLSLVNGSATSKTVVVEHRVKMKMEHLNPGTDQHHSEDELNSKDGSQDLELKSSEEDVQTPGKGLHHPGAVSRKSSRVSFNEDVEVANYYNHEQGEEEVTFWTSEDEEDEEIMRLYSPPSEADSVDQVLKGSIHSTASSLMYGGTQRLKSHELQSNPQKVLSNAKPGTTSIHPSGFVPLGERKVTAPKEVKRGRQAPPGPTAQGNSAKKGPVLRKPGKLVSERSPGTSRVVSTKPTTVRGTTKTLESRMHQALADLNISGPDRGKTFTTTKTSNSSSQTTRTMDLVKKPDINGLHLVPGGVRTLLGRPPSATEDRLRARRPSMQLMQILDRRRESMSTADKLQVAQERQKQQRTLP